MLLALMAPAFVTATLLPPIDIEPTLSLASFQARPYDPELADAYWRETYQAFARDDLEHPVEAGGVVFVGSSSIRLWPELERVVGIGAVVRRGFGGSLLADCARHVDALIAPSQPRAVVVYAGDNDLAGGASPTQVLDRYVAFVQAVHEQLPATRVVFLAIKPSPSRANLLPQVQAANRLIEQHAQTDTGVDFIDIHSLMLDGNGKPRLELFAPDRLHLSAAGYALWNSALLPHVR